MNKRLSIWLAALVLCACSTTPTTTSDAGSQPPEDAGGSSCQRAAIEADLMGSPEMPGLVGPGVDPETGMLREPGPEGYLVASTYLALRPEPAAQQRFGQLANSVAQRLLASPGLVAVQLATSEACGAARTITVWADEASMIGFVMSTEHTAAMSATSEVSRGGSATTHWMATSAASVSWTEAASRLALETPIY